MGRFNNSLPSQNQRKRSLLRVISNSEELESFHLSKRMILSRLRKFHHYLVFRDFLIREVISLHKAHLAKVIRTSLFFRQASKVSTVIKIPVKLRVLTFLANSIQVPVFFSHKNKEEAFSTKTTLSLESLQL